MIEIKIYIQSSFLQSIFIHKMWHAKNLRMKTAHTYHSLYSVQYVFPIFNLYYKNKINM